MSSSKPKTPLARPQTSPALKTTGPIRIFPTFEPSQIQNVIIKIVKSNAAKSSSRKARLQAGGRRWNPMQRSVLKIGLLVMLCAQSAFAQFWDVQRNLWTGEHDHFSGNTLISSATTLNNAGSLIYTNSAFPTNTGPLFYTGQWSSGDYWWALGVFDDGSDGAVINNTGTIQAIVTGYGSAQAIGVGSLQFSTITNSGTINAQVLNSDGEAMGVWADSGGTTLINNGTISARSQFSTVGVNAGNSIRIINNGTIQSIADAGTQGISANQSFADGIGTGSGLNISEYFENNGQLIAICTSTTATNQARTEAQWANGPTSI